MQRELAYGALGLPLAFAALPLYVHVPKLYAEQAGMALGLLGAILLAVRLADAFIDPVLGWLADHRDKRTLIALALIPLGSGFVFLMHPCPQFGPWWLALSLLLTAIGFSATSIAYQALGADLGTSPDARTRLVAAREGLGLLGVMLAAALPGYLAPTLSEGLALLSGLFVIALLLAAPITLWSARGPLALPAPQEVSGSFRTSLACVLGDAGFRRLLAVFVANGIAAALPATLVLFFVADVLDASAYAGGFLAIYFLAGVAGLPLWVALARRTNRARAWLLSMAVAALAFVWAFALGPGDLLGFALVCAATGLALGADLALPAAMAADIGERLRLPGGVFGVWNFVNKLNLALAAGVALPLLACLGYVPGQTSASGLLALSAVYALLPLAFKCLAALLLWPFSTCKENFE